MTQTYQTQYTDPTTGDVMMQARWYSPGTGTFRSRDTWAGDLNTPVTLNRYTYGANNPIRYWDPTGRLPCQNPKSDCELEVAQLEQNYHSGSGTGAIQNGLGLSGNPVTVFCPYNATSCGQVTLDNGDSVVASSSQEAADAQNRAHIDFFSQFIGTGVNNLPGLGQAQADYYLQEIWPNGASGNTGFRLDMAYLGDMVSAGLPPGAADYFLDHPCEYFPCDGDSWFGPAWRVEGWASPLGESQFNMSKGMFEGLATVYLARHFGPAGSFGASRNQGTTTVFRVEGPGNSRITIVGGDATVTGENMLFLNFGETARARQFWAQRLGQGFDDTVVKAFEVPTAYFDDLMAQAVPESLAGRFPNAPIIVDTTKAANQLGIRACHFTALQGAIIPGSGSITSC